MNDLKYQQPTKIYKDQFYDLLQEILHTTTTPKEEFDKRMRQFQTFVNRNNKNGTTPTFNAVIRHFNQNTKESDTTVMSNIIEIIANALPSFEKEWELLNVLRTYISIQRRKKISEIVKNPYTPMKKKAVTNPYTTAVTTAVTNPYTPALTKTVSEGTEYDDTDNTAHDTFTKIVSGKHTTKPIDTQKDDEFNANKETFTNTFELLIEDDDEDIEEVHNDYDRKEKDGGDDECPLLGQALRAR